MPAAVVALILAGEVLNTILACMERVVETWGDKGAEFQFDDSDEISGPPERVVLTTALDMVEVAFQVCTHYVHVRQRAEHEHGESPAL